ncbi:MAG: Hpt domain-containing protein [Silvanigrellales bacterium]|nr:Hpt domain-containing protein [Silvanigrellales bacterium]
MSGLHDVSSPYDSDPGLLEIIVQFVGTLEMEAPRLAECISKRDFPELVRLSHRLKGSSKVLGFETLGTLFGTLEDLARDALSAHSAVLSIGNLDVRDVELEASLQRIVDLFLAIKARYARGN